MAEDEEGLEALAELEREASEFNKVGKALFPLHGAIANTQSTVLTISLRIGCRN